MSMDIFAVSSSTHTEWVVAEGTKIIDQATTEDINPYFHTRREISHIIRLDLPPRFFKFKRNQVYFYGAGCSSPEKIKMVEASLVAQFKTPCSIYSDLLGAARGLLVDQPGIACILGTGSNSCVYDGHEITEHVAPLGYILGDEGSASYMGKIFIADMLKEIAPRRVCEYFYDNYNVTAEQLMDDIYINRLPNSSLASYSSFLVDHLDNDYVYELVYKGFELFFRRNVMRYDYKNLPLCFVGPTAVRYQQVLNEVAKNLGMEIAKITERSMPGILEYHALAQSKS